MEADLRALSRRRGRGLAPGLPHPEGEYAAVEQSAGKRSTFIENTTQRAEETGATQRIAGETWTRYEGDRYDALVLEDTPGSTTVVTGTASFAEMTKLAEALRAE